MYANVVLREETPEVEINPTNKVECLDLECVYVEFADDEGYAIELRRQHVEWHEEGCPPLL